jgi:hypothetical protein
MQPLRENLVAGVPLDFPMYRQLVGQMQGLTDALELSKQADLKLSGEYREDARS